ncbi:hypothetical protein M514_28416 [Trichuris suis]|uniref:Uncharacterized protein n=1 Tax=Trichuris suis TaxID=68888 RepID=A0A085MQA8_9BILA|nr:hypothetical protein M514_28416 [Trichuris suis]
MQSSFAPPCPFLEHPEKIAERRKGAILLNFLDTEGQCLFYSLQPKDDSYESTLKVLSGFFTPKVNVCIER